MDAVKLPTLTGYSSESHPQVSRVGAAGHFTLFVDHAGVPHGTMEEIAHRCNTHTDLVGALRFILAFYEPGQRHLDTEAWKLAEAAGRRALVNAERKSTDTPSPAPQQSKD